MKNVDMHCQMLQETERTKQQLSWQIHISMFKAETALENKQNLGTLGGTLSTLGALKGLIKYVEGM